MSISTTGCEQLKGVKCDCGGEVWFENLFKRGLASREFAWEAFCIECKSCDADGYRTRKELLDKSPANWVSDPSSQAT